MDATGSKDVETTQLPEDQGEHESCPDCNDTGYIWYICEWCDMQGVVLVLCKKCRGEDSEGCEKCGGAGEIEKKCRTCDGMGELPQRCGCGIARGRSRQRPERY
ncbi:hypothetical protein PT974_07951 [Cladobotryum mycophilum]|uniref:Uncharacterized protein n=1 Tax=Cladobotryum mycophilum TaxID=491253 RepID=A0ABR0SC24_9HYPO